VYVPKIELHECETLEEASAQLKQFSPHSRFMAGGTDLLVDLKTGRIVTTHLVSLRRIAALRGVMPTDGGLRIGAMTSVTDLNRSPLIQRKLPPLLDASRRMAAPPIRNMATVGGNIMSAVPCADLPPILTAMYAEVEVWSSGRIRRIPLDAFFAGPRRTLAEAGEILVAVFVPDLSIGFDAAYERFGLREGNAIPVASVAASLRIDHCGIITEARIVLGAVAPIPRLAAEAAKSLVGRSADDDAFNEAGRLAQRASLPISDVRGSAQFRRDLVEVLTRRALLKARERANGSVS